MSEQEAVNLIRKGYDRGWNQGDFSVMEEILHPNFIAHDPGSPTPVTGREAVKEILGSIRTAFPDVRREMLDWVADGDKIAVRWIVTGTHLGEFNGLGPTERSIRMTGITLYRIEDGKIAEEWVEMDALGLMRQLGQA